MEGPDEALDLADWRRRVAELYARVRASPDPEAAWLDWCATRSRLFRGHPQSPYPPGARPTTDLPHRAYDPGLRTTGEVEPASAERFEIAHSDTGTTPVTRIGVVRFPLLGHDHAVSIYWLDVYGGGLFLPFRDASNGDTTYGAGRYLIDTVKGADLGRVGRSLVLDFNFAYHPSCVHHPAWSCPLAPPDERLSVRVDGGEQLRWAPGS